MTTEAILEQEARKLYRAACHVAGVPDIEDLMQEARLALWRRNPPEGPATRRAARSAMIDALRRATRYTRTRKLQPVHQPLSLNGMSLDGLRVTVDPVEREPWMDRLFRQAISKPAVRGVMRRHYRGDETQDIARDLGLKPHTVHVYVWEGTRAVRLFLTQESQPHE